MRRHHYIRKLKKQQKYLIELKAKRQETKAKGLDQEHILNELMSFKKARLTVDQMPYEDLAV